ncbi:hypothetical protein ACOKM3_14300 [Streptomyces sp. BH106]|uniref:hypothetical protein n=1 Tax=Streptomyces sp. BH106 TaxID=3410409 RepID=UPI003CEB2B70
MSASTTTRTVTIDELTEILEDAIRQGIPHHDPQEAHTAAVEAAKEIVAAAIVRSALTAAT